MLFLGIQVLLLSCISRVTQPENKPVLFADFLNYQDIYDLRLTIYHMSSNILNRGPVGIGNLLGSRHQFRTTIYGYDLKDYIELFEQLNSVDLIPIESDGFLDARLFYTFQTGINDRLFTVIFRGMHGIFVNGIEVELKPIFFEVLIPFVPENVAKELKGHIEWIIAQ